jgi:hypothetical protein
MTGAGGVVIGHSPSTILPALIAGAGERADKVGLVTVERPKRRSKPASH